MAKTATQAPIIKMPKTIKITKDKTTKLPTAKATTVRPVYGKIPKVSKGLNGYLTSAGSNVTSDFQ